MSDGKSGGDGPQARRGLEAFFPTNRRSVIKAGMAGAAIPVVMNSVSYAAVSGLVPASPPLYAVVYDRRFAAGSAFAAEAGRHGVPGHGIDGDITAFWYEELDHRWRRSPLAIAGLTAHGPMFCLKTLAADQGMRLVYEGRHRPQADGSVAHTITGPESLVRAAVDRLGGQPEWSISIASVAMACPRTAIRHKPVHMTATSAAGPKDAPEDGWVSWVIAPVQRT